MRDTLLAKLSPDTDENRLRAQEKLASRQLHEGSKSINELAQDLERLLDQALPGLPDTIKDKELKFHLLSTLSDKLS